MPLMPQPPTPQPAAVAKRELSNEEKQRIMREVEAQLSAHRSKMSPEIYADTLNMAYQSRIGQLAERVGAGA